jgi:hypothetical protein
MILIICILIGLALGQHIKIAVSPELQAFFATSWAMAETKALPVATSAAKKIKAVAVKAVKTPQIEAG